MNRKTIIILGAGVGGIVAANELYARLNTQHDIILIEKNREHTFAPSFLWMMTGDRKPEQITKPTGKLIHSSIRLVESEVTHIDLSGKQVMTARETFAYDYLIIALGAELAPENIHGLVENSYSFYTFNETKKLKTALAQFDSGTIALVVSSLPYKCPGAPHEAAMLISDFFRRRGIRNKVEIHLYTPEPLPMPVAGPQLGEAVMQMLLSKNIHFHPLHKLKSVSSRELNFEGEDSPHYDLLIAIPPHHAPQLVREAHLSNESGWIPVDRHTLKTTYENVYAIGDITAISIPGRWKPDVPMMLPKAGIFAHAQAEIVAERIADEINGHISKSEFCGTGYCMLEAGQGLAGFAFGEFFGEPSPQLELRNLGKVWHFGKVLFEKWWLSSYGIKKSILSQMINLGGKLMRIPVKT